MRGKVIVVFDDAVSENNNLGSEGLSLLIKVPNRSKCTGLWSWTTMGIHELVTSLCDPLGV